MCNVVHCGSCCLIQMRPSVILFSVKRAPNKKIILHFDYIYDPLSIKINVAMGEMLL